jgi:hypothetical protein
MKTLLNKLGRLSPSRKVLVGASAAVAILSSAGQMAMAADQSQMMMTCNTYAARHLHVTESDIVDLSYEGQRTDGTHAVNGTARNGQTFQCSFNAKGTHVVNWFHSAPQGCPPDVSEANRYLYPDCG